MLSKFGTLLISLVAFIATSAYARELIPVLPLTNENQSVLVPSTLGIIVNGSDPQSVRLGHAYAKIRGVPESNIIELKLPRVNFVARHLMVRELEALRRSDAFNRLVGFVLTFDKPYRVDANQSITAAISQGVSTMVWSGACNLTEQNPDANAPPGASLKTKPAMMLLGGTSLDENIALAKRGKSADTTDPSGDIFLVKTTDAARSGPREPSMDRAAARLAAEISISTPRDQAFAHRSRIIGFQTGLPRLNNLETLGFLPGAFADHLTSFGALLEDRNPQTPITALIKAGATASFGTVREPCNFPGKFPDPERLIANYVHGDSLLEAYWKSVDMTTEGLLVGEPLSRPFPVADAELKDDIVTLRANRHTRPFLETTQRSAHDRYLQQKTAPDPRLGVYMVQTGMPQLLGILALPEDVVPGGIIGDIHLSVAEPKGLILGILPAR